MAGVNEDGVEVLRLEKRLILVRFHGHVETKRAKDAAHLFVTQLQQANDVRVWFDVRKVNAYPSGAREEWQAAVVPYRSHIAEIGVASSSALTRLGGSIFALFLRVPFRSLTDEDIDSLGLLP